MGQNPEPSGGQVRFGSDRLQRKNLKHKALHSETFQKKESNADSCFYIALLRAFRHD